MLLISVCVCVCVFETVCVRVCVLPVVCIYGCTSCRTGGVGVFAADFLMQHFQLAAPSVYRVTPPTWRAAFRRPSVSEMRTGRPASGGVCVSMCAGHTERTCTSEIINDLYIAGVAGRSTPRCFDLVAHGTCFVATLIIYNKSFAFTGLCRRVVCRRAACLLLSLIFRSLFIYL